MVNFNLKFEQELGFMSGNEMAAKAISQINYHIMGYFPITPSTEIAQYLDQMKSHGDHSIKLIPADGEHGSAGICYGASVAGARVVNATSANGLMYMLEQLPVQSGTRFPMVMNLVTRSVSGPLDIKGDHSDLYFALNSGWIILLASTPQEVYDLNIIGLKLSEHKDIRLPVMVAYDGFFTSHQKNKVYFFKDDQIVENFVGKWKRPDVIAVDPENAVTIGAHMNGDDLLNNHYQLNLAMEKAYVVYDEICKEYEKISGRSYGFIENYKVEDAEVVVCLLNSAAETAKETIDRLRDQGKKVGLVRPRILRPLPIIDLKSSFKDVKVVVVGDRADSYGSNGGNITHEIKSALYGTNTEVLSRVYGLGGKDIFEYEIEDLINLGYSKLFGEDIPNFDYFGKREGTESILNLTNQEKENYKTGLIKVTPNSETGKLKVKLPALRSLTKKPKRLGSGHGACPGCGIFSGLEMFFKGIEGDIVVLYQTGCGYVVTAGYPYTSHKQPFIHNLFQNGAATLSGTLEAFWEMKDRGEIPEISDDITFVMITGDGGMDIGMGSAIGTALRNHKMIILEYDNEGYMNTGSQMSYSTPFGHRTTTTNVGKTQQGKRFHHKDTAQIMAATNIPYVFTAVEAFPQDMIKKAAKAQWYAQNVGLVYGKILITCPLNWISDERYGTSILEKAVNCGFFPLYEVEQGDTAITYNPEEKGNNVDVSEWLSMMGKSKHLLRSENKDLLDEFRNEISRRWERLKKKNNIEGI